MKIKWIGQTKVSPIYKHLEKGVEFECLESHAKTFIEGGQAIAVSEIKTAKAKQPKGD
jgi:hypothetical protein